MKKGVPGRNIALKRKPHKKLLLILELKTKWVCILIPMDLKYVMTFFYMFVWNLFSLDFEFFFSF